MLDNLLDGPDHIVGVGLLADFAVDLGRVLELLGVSDQFGRCDARADWGEAVKGLCVAVENKVSEYLMEMLWRSFYSTWQEEQGACLQRNMQAASTRLGEHSSLLCFLL